MAPVVVETRANEVRRSNGTRSETPLQMICQGPCLPSIPRHPTFAAHRQWMLEKMALAFRVFARKGYTDGMAGHISVRDPEFPHTFWINPLAKHFALMRASDMVHVDYGGEHIRGSKDKTVNAAGFLIHGAIHQARDDVQAVCHVHSPHGMAWSIFARPLEMLTQDIAYLYGDAQAVYRDFGGTVLTMDEATRATKALGPRGKGMILQNHGLLTVGHTVDEACFLMTLMERACQCQLLAEAAAANGVAKMYISEESARYTFENSSDSETLYWEGQPDLEFEEHMSDGQHR